MERWLTDLWYRGGPAARLLQPLAALYGAVMRRRARAYATGRRSSFRVQRPIVIVGNLTVGGTGKTPLVIWLAQQLSGRGLKVGILSRGYGRKDSAVRFVDDMAWQEVGDEPLLLRQRTGCLTVVAVDRVAGAEALVSRGVDVIVADDGLQHLRLVRDCEIVVIDGARGFGNGRLLPAGPLREPISRLARVDVIVINGPAEHDSLASLGPTSARMDLQAIEARRVDESESQPLSSFHGQRAHAIAGIGNPARFFRELRAQGLEVIEHPFPDHHPFTADELEFGDALPVLMTEKDAVKCRAFAHARCWYVPVSARFGEPQGRELLEHVLRKLHIPPSAGG